MPLTKQQAQALAHLANLLRPEWDEQGIFKQLATVAGRNEFDVTLATIRAAADLGAKTPGVIPTDGPHWRERASEQRSPRNPQPHEECGQHPGQYRLSCSGCAGDRKAKRDEARAEQEAQAAASKAEAIEAIRASLNANRERMCGHGVDRALCADHRDETETADRKASR